MSYVEVGNPSCTSTSGSVALRIEPRERDLGQFIVRRVLPASEITTVGPFIFFDHMGPAEFPPGQGIQVRPHPHIGLATVTYLIEGEIVHRDSLGYNQSIRPGAVNLMTAGRGIVHSERAGEDFNEHSILHGIQSWIALPEIQQEREPSFAHYPATEIPETKIDGVRVKIIMGAAFGLSSPVVNYSPTLYLECHLPQYSSFCLPESFNDLAAYVVTGEVEIDDCRYPGGVMAVACPGKTVCLHAAKDSHVMVIGGDSIGQRHLWWNFVSSSRERIEAAKADWKEDRFESVPGDSEHIPLPEA